MAIAPQLSGTNWTTNYTTIASYPGEWAIIDANGAKYGFGFGVETTGGGNNTDYWLSYIKIERLEIKNAGTSGSAGGLCFNGGPLWVRYCYIHDNATYSDVTNKSGLWAYISMGSIIEYNWFYNNGGNAGHNNAHIIIFSDYLYDDGPTYDFDACNRDNEIRYNYFSGTAYCGYKSKAAQYLGAYDNDGSMTDMTHQTSGNEIHHNIFTGCAEIAMKQDFEQVHHNICDGVDIVAFIGSTEYPNFWKCVYNNTVINGYILETLGYTRSEAALDLDFTCLNNIVTAGGTPYGGSMPFSIGVGVDWQRAAACTLSYTWTNTLIDRNHAGTPTTHRITMQTQTHTHVGLLITRPRHNSTHRGEPPTIPTPHPVCSLANQEQIST